eukprot:1008064-Amphidinium_carterae.1
MYKSEASESLRTSHNASANDWLVQCRSDVGLLAKCDGDGHESSQGQMLSYWEQPHLCFGVLPCCECYTCAGSRKTWMLRDSVDVNVWKPWRC